MSLSTNINEYFSLDKEIKRLSMEIKRLRDRKSEVEKQVAMELDNKDFLCKILATLPKEY